MVKVSVSVKLKIKINSNLKAKVSVKVKIERKRQDQGQNEGQTEPFFSEFISMLVDATELGDNCFSEVINSGNLLLMICC